MYKGKKSLSCQIGQYLEVLGAFNGLSMGRDQIHHKARPDP